MSSLPGASMIGWPRSSATELMWVRAGTSMTAGECWKITASTTSLLPGLGSSTFVVQTPKSALPDATSAGASVSGPPSRISTSSPAAR